MNQIVKSSKKILRGFVENTPILRDLYYYHWLFPRNPNLYRGFFGSFAEGFDIFLTCGTLQYLEPSLSELLSKLQSQPQHLIINHVPFYNGDEYITLQNLLVSYAPYKIQNRANFIDSIEKLGYELVDSWQQNRTCSIPFKPERFVDAYHGFYFRYRSI